MGNFEQDLDELLELYYKWQCALDRTISEDWCNKAADRYFEARSRLLKYGAEPDIE